jgi:KipI family sensor histidine kinase inhibitor
VRLMPAGTAAVLAEVADLEEMMALYRGLQQARDTPGGHGITELVPAVRTVLIEFDPAITTARRVAELAAEQSLTAVPDDAGDVVTIQAVYDGPDLDATCEALGMTRAAFVLWHTEVRWRVAFTGFAPGFGYLVSPGHTVSIPRLREPRTKVPAGSIAMADVFTGIYPTESPGGWRIVGRTDHLLFDVDRPQPVTLTPGTAVRFEERP